MIYGKSQKHTVHLYDPSHPLADTVGYVTLIADATLYPKEEDIGMPRDYIVLEDCYYSEDIYEPVLPLHWDYVIMDIEKALGLIS